jgi:uncharacterized protein YecE (DUF72 family)
MSGRIRIGTSGWVYPHWRGPFYPEDLAPAAWLDFYARRFDSVEINNTFYRLPSVATLRDWRERVPCDFRFAVKASRYITHMKKLKDPKASVSSLFERIEVLGDRVGPVLFQIPPNWRFDGDRLDRFLRELSGDYRYAFEFRDHSWLEARTFALLSRHRAALCIYELDGFHSPKQLTTDFVYIRLHGPGAAYEGSYDVQTLAGWAGAISSWCGQGHDVWCYFDNDQDGFAALDAARLHAMLTPE